MPYYFIDYWSMVCSQWLDFIKNLDTLEWSVNQLVNLGTWMDRFSIGYNVFSQIYVLMWKKHTHKKN